MVRERTDRRPRWLAVLVTLTLALALLAGCGAGGGDAAAGGDAVGRGDAASEAGLGDAAAWAPDRDASYYDLEHVVLYLDAYDELPPNYVCKEEAREAGWEGGSVERVIPGAAIGGDRFGNYEGALPELAGGDEYRECDIDTNGRGSRGPERLIYVADGGSDEPGDAEGPYYYTKDHYETFAEVTIADDGEVSVDE